MTANIDWLTAPVAALDVAAAQAAEQRQQQLTKPAGALGQLEAVAIQLAAMQGQPCPALDEVQITLFAADHGIAAHGVSAYPQAVTAQMITNFAAGGAAISVLAALHQAPLEIVVLGTVVPLPATLAGVRQAQIAPMTASLHEQPAMTATQLAQALNQGREAVQRAARAGAQLFIGGEMGIGNTTAATALACARLGLAPTQLAGPGTGLDPAGVAHKVTLLQQALALHSPQCDSALETLCRLGGFEIAALCGAYLAAAQQGMPVLVDGFICSVAALMACALNADVRHWLLFSHCGAEPGHQTLLAALDAQPLLQLGLRLGEASGAAVALPLLRQACALHRSMATFADAGVSEKEGHE